MTDLSRGARRRAGRRPRSVFVDLALSMVALGAITGVIFPMFVVVLGVPSAYAFRVRFIAACLAAGLGVATGNYLLVRRVVCRRLRPLADGMRAFQQRLDASGGENGWLTLDVGRYRLDADAPDQFGASAVAFNRMVDSLRIVNEQLEMLTLTDPLTGLANRRHFDERFSDAWQRALATGGSVAVAMIDVDHFKQYNDGYGHLAGDECLRRVAAALSGSVREGSDLLCRYGGEEFAIVLSDADAGRARAVAERARAAVAAVALPHPETERDCVTVSVGVAAREPATAASPDVLIKAADEALYRAKQHGRDRVCEDGAPSAGEQDVPGVFPPTSR
ncbi:GGDEF domain-containing protein [Actinoplanes sp. NPDC049316]|uniref:GGDEF domain-containing protein n=1 Tax=Actinoplanes sp. NPDC049316 TaxID=3154727 RepID=UPI003416DA35